MKAQESKSPVSRRHFVASGIAAPFLLLPKRSHAGINLVYEMTIGDVDNWI